jgi:hypothetical protein
LIKINCRHGFFRFIESTPGECAEFSAIFGFELARFEDSFTFEGLALAKDYSILGGQYLGNVATATYAGDPGEVMRANELVYDFRYSEVTPIASITQPVEISQSGFYYVSNGLILPGSIRADGTRVTDYSAWYLFDKKVFRYSEVTVG